MTAQAPDGGKARRTWQGLIEATWAEIAASGSFTAERVAARAGTSPATFYAYFASKDVALTEAFSRALDGMVELVDESLSVERLLDVGLACLCRSFVRDAARFFEREALVFRLALARLPEHRPLRATYRDHQAAVFGRYQRFLELGSAAGKIRADSGDAVVTAMMVTTQGLNNSLLLTGRGPHAVCDELADSLTALLAPRT